MYVVGIHKKLFDEMLLMSAHKIYFYQEIRKKLSQTSHQILILNKSSVLFLFLTGYGEEHQVKNNYSLIVSGNQST